MLQVIHVRTKRMEGNAYLLYEDAAKEAALIDGDFGAEKLVDQADTLGLRIRYILLTHGHFDHIGALDTLKKLTGAPVCIGAEDGGMLTDNLLNMSAYTEKPPCRCMPDRLLTDGECLPLGEETIHTLHTPGHTPGSMCFLAEPYLFSGDTLFSDSTGATHFPGGSETDMEASIDVLRKLPGNLQLLPGHNEPSTLKEAIWQVTGGVLW